jgi:hypothetical protein
VRVAGVFAPVVNVTIWPLIDWMVYWPFGFFGLNAPAEPPLLDASRIWTTFPTCQRPTPPPAGGATSSVTLKCAGSEKSMARMLRPSERG